MASIIIGLSGKKRSGKDSVAARLIQKHGFTRVAFADPLKHVLAATDPTVRVEADETGLLGHPPGVSARYMRLAFILSLVGWEIAKEIREVRRLLQMLGTEGGRAHLGEGVWISALARTVDAIPGPVVISDVRLTNEAEWVEDRGLLVRVERPGLAPSADAHRSETELDSHPFPRYLWNNGTVADLHREADALADTAASELAIARLRKALVA